MYRVFLSFRYPRELFKEWPPTEDKSQPGFYTLVPVATRTTPSIRVIVLPETDKEQYPFLQMVSTKTMELKDVLKAAEQITQFEDVNRRDDGAQVLSLYFAQHPEALEKLRGETQMTDLIEYVLGVLDPAAKARYEREADERVQKAQQKADARIAAAEKKAQQAQQVATEAQSQLQASNKRIAELEALLAARA